MRITTQQDFENQIRFRHSSSEHFLASIRNSVAKQAFHDAAGRKRSKLLNGAPGPLTVISHDVRKSVVMVAANNALRVTDKELMVNDLRLSWDDDQLKDWAKCQALKCSRIVEKRPQPEIELRALVESYGLEWREKDDLFGPEPAIRRACCEKWWRRQARVLKVRKVDQLARSFRMVHAKGQIYASNEAVRLRRVQSRRNRQLLEGMVAENDEGQEYTLAELADLSTSNPVNRRNELMVRMRGFEQVADELGHVGLFVTITCPSMFHPMRQIKNKAGKVVRVEKNKNYLDFTPREAQAWLTKTWELIRAKLHRDDIRLYGFRVVEPNHDGCPHWHMLVFCEKANKAALCQELRRFPLRTDGFSRGAGYRVKIVPIDKSKGSATGYIAKYISKNIDGSHIENDLFGNAGATAAERICAWASTWGIRQFQQIGGVSVTVWRELRRLQQEEAGHNEQIRKAADASDWAAFCLLMGGVFARRDEQPLRPAYWLEFDAETGEEIDASITSYGEHSAGRIFGLRDCGGEYLLTRFYRWSVERIGFAGEAVSRFFNQAAAPPALDLCQ